jgi:hypothetical protein
VIGRKAGKEKSSSAEPISKEFKFNKKGKFTKN